jgi:hypothetical protein
MRSVVFDKVQCSETLADVCFVNQRLLSGSHLDANFLSRRLLSGADVDQLHPHGVDENMLATTVSSCLSSIG